MPTYIPKIKINVSYRNFNILTGEAKKMFFIILKSKFRPFLITDNQNSIEKNVPLDKNELFETAFFTTNPIQTYPSHTLNTKHTETQTNSFTARDKHTHPLDRTEK